MRPKIMTSRSIARSLNYNEEKVRIGKAQCLTAANFLKDLSRLTQEDKLHCFQRRMDLNERVCTSQHITLNFDPGDKLSNDQMKKIAGQYMKDIGFERQPYLVYRHLDAGHPHCHIVTTHIRRDGSPIELFNIGRNQSEKARQQIEVEYGLVTAEMKKQVWEERQKIDGVQRIKYGEKSITQSISRVLEHVTENYKFTSLEELNTVLRLYNVEAYRGKEGSQLYQHRGLLYRVLDERGKYIGVPLKASFFECKPTLTNLEKKFELNQPLKQQSRQRVTTQVRWELFQSPNDLKRLAQRLTQEHIRMDLQLDKEGKCKEVTYIDFRNKAIFNGNELGDHCNRDAIQKVIDSKKALEKDRSLQKTQEQELVHRHRHSLDLEP
jgi:hypothetical protein